MEQEKSNISNYGAENSTKPTVSHDTLESLKANNVSIIEPAEVPIKHIKPKKTINILLAIILGLFGGVGLAFFLDYLDDTVRGVEELEHLTNWPLLGSIPIIDAENKLSELQKDIFIHTYPKANASEAYRTFRTSVLFSSTEEHPVKSLLITSPGPAEGKTITLCNLGVAIAQSKKSVLLVDGDMRKPRLHEVFQKKTHKGLSNYLCGQAEFADLPQDTPIEHLNIVTSGNVPPNPSELLASHKLKEFLHQACEKFDYVIFDSPPVSLLTDTSLIARVVDGIVIVVENGKTSKRALERIAKNLKGHKVRILGTFLNSTTESSKNYYSYYQEQVQE